MSHVPERTCVGCRTKLPKAQLMRVVRGSDGAIELDRMAQMPGRGAYFCASEGCWQAGLRKHVLDKALRVNIPVAARDALMKLGHTMGVE